MGESHLSEVIALSAGKLSWKVNGSRLSSLQSDGSIFVWEDMHLEFLSNPNPLGSSWLYNTNHQPDKMESQIVPGGGGGGGGKGGNQMISR